MDTLIEEYIHSAFKTAAENMMLRPEVRKKSYAESLPIFFLQNQLTAWVVLQTAEQYCIEPAFFLSTSPLKSKSK